MTPSPRSTVTPVSQSTCGSRPRLSPAPETCLSLESPPTTPRLGSALVVLVVAAPPVARLVASPGGAVEPLVHAPEAVQSARIGRMGVVDDAVLEHERAHARPIAREGERVGSAHGRGPRDRLRDLCRVQCVAAALVVVFDEPLALLLLG